MYITKINDEEYCRVMKKELKKNNNYCPDAIAHTPDMKCPCKQFREQEEEGFCAMGYLYKHMEDEDNA